MKPVRGRVIVSVDLNQRDMYELELAGGVSIYMRQIYGFDGKITQSCLATIVDGGEYEHLKKGDVVLCNFNSFNRGNPPHGMIGVDPERKGFTLFTLEYNFIYFKWVDGSAVPLPDYIIAERIPVKEESSVLEIPDNTVKTHPTMFNVLSAGVDCEGVKSGDRIITYPKSDLEVHFSYDKKAYQVIRIKYSDVLGVMN